MPLASTVFIDTDVKMGARSLLRALSHESMPANARSYEVTGITSTGAFLSTVWIPKKNVSPSARSRSAGGFAPIAWKNSVSVSGRAAGLPLASSAPVCIVGTICVIDPSDDDPPLRAWASSDFTALGDFPSTGYETVCSAKTIDVEGCAGSAEPL